MTRITITVDDDPHGRYFKAHAYVSRTGQIRIWPSKSEAYAALKALIRKGAEPRRGTAKPSSDDEATPQSREATPVHEEKIRMSTDIYDDNGHAQYRID